MNIGMIYGFVVLISVTLLLLLLARHDFRVRRYRGRFAKAFLKEFNHAYPDTASLVTPDLGSKVARALVKNKRIASELNDLERQLAKRPDIRNKSYAYIDPDYSRETRELVSDLLNKKIELAGKLFDCLPPKAKTQIHKKAESIDGAAEEAGLADEELRKARQKNEERAKYLGLKAWRFDILMNVYNIANRANTAAS